VSLFSGVGGFDLGFDQAGWECVAQVEWDKHCQQILSRHWPDVPRWEDIADVNGHDLPSADCVIFGSPCQDLSVAGKQAGLAGDRSSLFFEACRVIGEMREASDGRCPTWAVWENVPGALSSNGGRDFGAVLDALAELGAVALEWRVLDAQWFGVPQRRRRVFVIACFDPRIGSGPQVLPVGAGVRRHSAKSRSFRQKVAGTSGSSVTSGGVVADGKIVTALTTALASGSFDPARAQADWLVPATLVKAGSVTSGGVVADGDIVTALTTQLASGGPDVARAQAGWLVPATFVKAGRAQTAESPESWREGEVAPTLNAFDAGDTRATVAICDVSAAVTAKWAKGTGGPSGDECQNLVVAFSHTQGLDPQPPAVCLAPTLTASNDPSRPPQSSEITQQVAAVIEAQIQVRRLTPVECERLMGWPDDHTRWHADGKEQADSPRYRQCGNGVATPVARWIATQLLKAMS
jgi:DNA (cytosine-5)-methyltransferase 1